MSAQKYLTRLKNIDLLIQDEVTGRPKELAAKLNISERMIYRYIQNMKDLGAPLEFNNAKQSYIYTNRVALIVDIAYQPVGRRR